MSNDCDADADDVSRLRLVLKRSEDAKRSLENEIFIEREHLNILRADLRCCNEAIRSTRRAIAASRTQKKADRKQ